MAEFTSTKSNHAALNETVIQLAEYRYWRYTAVDPEMSDIHHIQLYSTTTTVLTEQFLHELTAKHSIVHTERRVPETTAR